MVTKNIAVKNGILGVIVLFLVGGLLTLAIMDASYRPAFADLVKITVGAYIGLLMPQNKSLLR